VREYQPDALATNLIHADLFGRIFGRLFGVKKIVCYQHGQLLQWEFLRIFDRMTKFLVTRYIVQTKTAKRELIKKLRLPKEMFEVIPNTIDSKEFDFEIDQDNKRKGLGLTSDDSVLTCVSNLRRGKGHEYLLKAFEELYAHPDPSVVGRKGPRTQNLKLLIVGDGEQKEKLLKQAENYISKPDILFLGNRTDVKEILKISDIFVLPTLGEGMSIAIMEAMASGLPIITTDLHENRELITDKETGLLVPPESTTSPTRAIQTLIDDKLQRNTLGENARRKILDCFDIEIVVSKLMLFFKKL